MIGKLKRWHWLLISVIVGLAVPLVRGAFEGELYGLHLDGYGYRLTNQGRFEQGLVEEYQGRRAFKDVTVYPRWETPPGGGARHLVYLVAGKYFGGQPESRDGQLVARWSPSYFIAPVPYTPQHYPLGVAQGAIDRFAQLPQPTVMDYLSLVQGAGGPGYTYAWWAAWPRLTWLVGSVLLLGIVWPTLVNLYLYGSIHRPPDDVQIRLVGPGVSSTPQRQPTGPTEADLRHLAELDAALEQGLLAGATASSSAATTESTATVRKLDAAPLESVASANGESAEFGKKQEDFYPTERRRHASSNGHP